jgi:iron complex outermembrane receptor protein
MIYHTKSNSLKKSSNNNILEGDRAMSDVSIRLLISASIFAIAVSAAPYSAKAQSDSAGGVEEITVTARRHEEKLLEVPVAITAVTAQTLETQGIASLQDLAAYTPGLSDDNNNAGGNRADRSASIFVIRGMYPGGGGSPTTSVFINGAPLSASFASGLDDALARVEVLKGPQSAYFGRQTFAGAINLVTKDPSKTFDGDVSVLIGSRNYRDLRGMVEGSLIDGILTAQATFRDYSKDGSYSNEAKPAGKANPNETLGDQSTRAGSLTLVFTPIDNLKVKAFGTLWNDDDGPGAQAEIYGNSSTAYPNSGQGNCLGGHYICGVAPHWLYGEVESNSKVDQNVAALLANATGPNGTGAYNNLFKPNIDHFGLNRDAYHVDAAIDYYIESLGVTIGSTTGANKQTYTALTDLDNADGSSIPNVGFGSYPTVQAYYNWPTVIESEVYDHSQDLRLTSDQDQRFRWTVGANYYFSKSATSVNLSSTSSGLPSAKPAWTETETIGAYYGLAFDIFPDLTLNFEGRYQVDKISRYLTAPNGVGATDAGLRAFYHNYVPRTSLEYKFAEGWMAYATYSEGVNPGQFNTYTVLNNAGIAYVQSLAGVGTVVQPEYLKNYEIGAKGKFLDGKATLAGDIYYDIWSNQIVANTFVVPASVNGTQLTVNNTIQIVSPTTNVGKSTLKGIEIEGTLAPVQHVLLNGGFALNDTRYDQYPCIACTAVQGTTVANRYVGGNQFPHASKYQGNLGAQYTDDLLILPGWQWHARGDYYYKSGSYDLPSDFAQTPASNTLNLRAGIETDDIKIEAFVTNVTNDGAYTSVLSETDFRPGTGANAFSQSALTLGLPDLRTYGVQVKYKFGGESASAPAPAAYTPPPVVAPKPASTARSYQVFFDFNKSDLTPQAVTIVDTAAKNAGPAKVTEIEVTGHTDTVGSDAYNMRLSRRRAESVAAELEKQGIPSKEIAIFAKGKKDLLVPTADGVKEPQNRRVQIVYAGGAAS